MELLLVCNYKFVKKIANQQGIEKRAENKKSTYLVLVMSQQLPPWGGVVHAGDPIICQLLPDVEYFLGFVVGQLATVPLGGVKQCEQTTLITAMGKKRKFVT